MAVHGHGTVLPQLHLVQLAIGALLTGSSQADTSASTAANAGAMVTSSLIRASKAYCFVLSPLLTGQWHLPSVAAATCRATTSVGHFQPSGAA